MFNIVMVEPEIPQNTGNIVRTAAATGCHVHLIKPLGFDISDRALKRAGLDYWHLTDFTVYENLTDFFEKITGIHHDFGPDDNWNVKSEDENGPRFFFSSTKAHKTYDQAEFRENDYILFGKETKGLPEELLRDNYNETIRIPMIPEARSLNLSNSVAIVVYEGMRQNRFKNLQDFGHLTRF